MKEGFRAGQRLLAGFGLFMSLVMLGGAEPCLRLVLPAGDAAALGPAMGYLRLVPAFTCSISWAADRRDIFGAGAGSTSR